jgi:hypothetical protein
MHVAIKFAALPPDLIAFVNDLFAVWIAADINRFRF